MSFPIWNTDSYTTDFIYSLPEGKRAELIDGQVYYMAPPTRIHQEISFSLSRKIAYYIDTKGGSCRVYPSPFAVFLNQDNRNYVEPDISVICDPQKLDDKGCNGAPDWVIEIVSPSNPSDDYIRKLYYYKNYGVREYWIIDPQRKNITVNYFEQDLLNVPYTFDAVLKVNIYEDLYINFSDISKLLHI